MGPQVSQLRVDRALTNISLAFFNADFVADRVLPVVPNLKADSGKIAAYGNEHLRIYTAKRALYDTNQKRIEWSTNLDARYDIEYFDLDGYVPDRVIEQAEEPFDARRDAMLMVQHALMLERERALAVIMTDTAVLTQNTTLSGTSQWNDYANSTPEVDITTAKNAVFDATGLEANRVLMSRKVLETLKLHPFFVDQVRGVRLPSSEDVVNILKNFFGFDEVVIGKAKYISSNEGQTETMADVWGKDFVVYYAPKTPSLFAKSFGYSFQLKNHNWTVRTRREPQADKGELINVEHARDDKILTATAAYLIKNAIA